MTSTAFLLSLLLVASTYVDRALCQTCYTAGVTGLSSLEDSSNGAIYVNNAVSSRAPCSGTVYAWHYCYYPIRNTNNLGVAFGVYQYDSDDSKYFLRNGSHYELHLPSRQDSFTCGTEPLSLMQRFQIYAGDRVGACLKDDNGREFLDILTNSAPSSYKAAKWGGSSGSCSESSMSASEEEPSVERGAALHLYVDINIDECALGEDNCHSILVTCSDEVGGSGSFICTCKTGYTGDGVTCNNIDECTEELHNCVENANCTDTEGSYTCSCSIGYTGTGDTMCANVDECALGTHMCCQHTNCSDTDGSYSCVCNTGYTANGQECNDINECAINSCDINATCNNTVGSYECICNTGYSGNGITCTDMNECQIDSYTCDMNTECLNTNGSYDCVCMVGYSGDGMTCTDVDECQIDSYTCDMNAECLNTNGSYDCVCMVGYSGDGMSCTDIDECENATICGMGGTCNNTVGNYTCECQTGYTLSGRMCQDVNECSEQNNCSADAECENTQGSHMCRCREGYTGDGSSCEDVDECQIDSYTCDMNAECLNTNGSYDCVCMVGYSGDGMTCTDIDECENATICGMGGTCNNTVGNYTCECQTGYTLSGRMCQDVNECSGQNNCSADAECENTQGSHMCRCREGYTGDGSSCEDVDECQIDSYTCDMNAECLNTNGSCDCVCMVGYSGDGMTCTDIDECENATICGMGGTCNNTVGNYTCECQTGYTLSGRMCQDVNECSGQNNCSADAECENTQGSHMCRCREGYTRDGSSCEDVDECSNGAHLCGIDAECRNLDGGFECFCNAGLRWNGQTCEDIDECNSTVSGTCNSNAFCINTDGSYQCQCMEGYTGDGSVCQAIEDAEKLSSGPSGLSAAAIAGVTITIVTVIVVIVIVAICIIRRNSVICVKFKETSRKQNKSDALYFVNPTYGNIQMRSIEPSDAIQMTSIKVQASDAIQMTSIKVDPSDIYDYPDSSKFRKSSNVHNWSASLKRFEPGDYSEVIFTEELDYSTVMEKEFQARKDSKENEAPYYSPADQETELYSQLRHEKIRAISEEQIEIGEKIGSGEFGDVCRGFWRSMDYTLDVALKTQSRTDDRDARVKLLQEAAIMSQFKHTNVIKLYGVVNDTDQLMLVLEFLNKGDLRHFLCNMAPNPGEQVSPQTPKMLLNFSQQIALGMDYLSRKNFVHRDLAARNILLSANNICKISDFGMSRNLLDDDYYVSYGGKIPLKWTAPEAISYRKYSTASDVWSYGCVLYEIWSLGHKPFGGVSNEEVLMQVECGYRLPPPPGCPRKIYELMIHCWNPDSSCRPMARKLFAALMDSEDAVLNVLEEGRVASTLGAPLEAGENMYRDLQEVYYSSVD